MDPKLVCATGAGPKVKQRAVLRHRVSLVPARGALNPVTCRVWGERDPQTRIPRVDSNSRAPFTVGRLRRTRGESAVAATVGAPSPSIFESPNRTLGLCVRHQSRDFGVEPGGRVELLRTQLREVAGEALAIPRRGRRDA